MYIHFYIVFFFPIESGMAATSSITLPTSPPFPTVSRSENTFEFNRIDLPLTISFESLTVSVYNLSQMIYNNLNIFTRCRSANEKEEKAQIKIRDYKQIIINKLTGIIPSNNITAIMGPSGSGKTTLLNVLRGDTHSVEITGIVRVNGEVIKSTKNFRTSIAFVPQVRLSCTCVVKVTIKSI